MTADGLQSLKNLHCSQAEITSLLERVAPWAEEFQWDELVSMTNYLSAYEVSQGAWVFRQGSPGSFVCLIASGQVDIVKEAQGNEVKTLATLGTGRVIGEMAMMDGQPRSGGAIANQDTTLLVMTTVDAKRLSEEKPRLALRISLFIAQTISRRLRQSSGKLIDLI